MMTTDIAIEYYAGRLPSFAGTELNRLYGNIYSSPEHFALYGGLENADTYVARRNGEVIALFPFRREGGRVRVLNEGMVLPEEEVKRFADYIFHAFPGVHVIEFHAVHARLKKLPLPYQQFYWSEDYLLNLPSGQEQYLAMLGSATRKNIRKHLNRLQRDFPDFEYRTYEKSDISEEDLRDIVGFNRVRMAAKNVVSAIDENELQMMLRLARQCGLLCVARINGRTCAGTLLFRFDGDYVSRVNAHDTKYDDYRLGTIACYLAICECIRRQGRRFHFMWGRYSYKSALAGELCQLDHIAVYRSRWHLLCNARLASQIAYQGILRQAKLWLLSQPESGSGMLQRLLSSGVQTLRQLKRAGLRRPAS